MLDWDLIEQESFQNTNGSRPAYQMQTTGVFTPTSKLPCSDLSRTAYRSDIGSLSDLESRPLGLGSAVLIRVVGMQFFVQVKAQVVLEFSELLSLILPLSLLTVIQLPIAQNKILQEVSWIYKFLFLYS